MKIVYIMTDSVTTQIERLKQRGKGSEHVTSNKNGFCTCYSKTSTKVLQGPVWKTTKVTDELLQTWDSYEQKMYQLPTWPETTFSTDSRKMRTLHFLREISPSDYIVQSYWSIFVQKVHARSAVALITLLVISRHHLFRFSVVRIYCFFFFTYFMISIRFSVMTSYIRHWIDK